MRFRIRNELNKTDYERLTDFFRDNPDALVEFFPGLDLEFVSVSPVTIVVEGYGYKIDAETLFGQPLGFEVNDDLRLVDVRRASITVNRRKMKLSKIVVEEADLENDLNVILRIVERVVNHVCIRFDKMIEQIFSLDSEWLDGQLSTIYEKEELEKIGEIPSPFGTIHARGSKDARNRAAGLIPLYKERDKMYLYDAKRVYFLLPHDFVANLLRCDDSTMMREDEFDERGREVLRDLVYKKRLKKHETLGGIICYFGLDDKTRRYLVKNLNRKTSRL